MIPEGYSRRLDIFVTNRCNLRCEYCSSRDMLNFPVSLSLGFKEMSRAADLFALYGKSPAPEPRTIAFSGGEPFLEFDEVARTISHIRRQREKFLISLTTNGTLLNEERVRFLAENGVCLIVSLDGTRGATDRHRKFSSGGGSVSDAVIRNLKKLPPGYLRPVHVTVTVTSGTIGSVVRSARFLESLGFEYVEIGLDVYETWTREKLALLKKTLADFRNYSLENADLGALRRGGGNIFRSFFQDYAPRGEILPVDTLCLSPEGFFFPCDALCAARPRQDEYIIGDLKKGVDFKKFRKIYSEAFSFILKHGSVDGVLSPADRYFYAITHHEDPAAILENGRRVGEIFAGELGDLKEMEASAVSSAKRGHPRGEAMRSLREELSGARRKPAGGYGALDLLLSSGGNKKSVIFGGKGGDKGLGSAKAAFFYLLLAAKASRKKVSVFVEK